MRVVRLPELPEWPGLSLADALRREPALNRFARFDADRQAELWRRLGDRR
jgi:hypothetical protein